MAITNYSELKSAIADWLDRTDLTDSIPNFIALTEARHKRDFKLRRLETRVTANTVADQEYYSLPDNYIAMRNIQLNTDPKTSLEYLTPEQMDRLYAGSNKGKPKAYTIIKDTVVITMNKYQLTTKNCLTTENISLTLPLFTIVS